MKNFCIAWVLSVCFRLASCCGSFQLNYPLFCPPSFDLFCLSMRSFCSRNSCCFSPKFSSKFRSVASNVIVTRQGSVPEVANVSTHSNTAHQRSKRSHPSIQPAEAVDVTEPHGNPPFFARCCLGKVPGGAPFSQLYYGDRQNRKDRP